MSTSTTRRPRRYRIDWVQLVAAECEALGYVTEAERLRTSF